MQVTVKHKTMTKALDAPTSRIVLGTEVYDLYLLVKVVLVLLVGTCLVLFFSAAMGATLPIGVLAGAVGLGYMLAGWQSRLILDLTHSTYVHEFGLPPLMKRRQGHLDAFSHLSLTRQMRTVSESGKQSSIWRLALIPRADARVTEPIVIAFAGGDQSATATVALSQRLAKHVALPLRNESLEAIPESQMPIRVAFGFLLFFVGVIILGNAYIGVRNRYECRGAHFPVDPGMPTSSLLINHRMGACTVRSLEVTAPRYGWIPNGCNQAGAVHGPCQYVVTPYSIALDIENTGSRLSTLNFVTGFDTQTQTHGSSGPLQPHTHRRVTVDVVGVKIGPPPELRPDPPLSDLFLREEDGG